MGAQGLEVRRQARGPGETGCVNSGLGCYRSPSWTLALRGRVRCTAKHAPQQCINSPSTIHNFWRTTAEKFSIAHFFMCRFVVFCFVLSLLVRGRHVCAVCWPLHQQNERQQRQEQNTEELKDCDERDHRGLPLNGPGQSCIGTVRRRHGVGTSCHEACLHLRERRV